MKKGAVCSYNSGPDGLITLDPTNSDLQLEFTTVLVLKNADSVEKINISNKLKERFITFITKLEIIFDLFPFLFGVFSI